MPVIRIWQESRKNKGVLRERQTGLKHLGRIGPRVGYVLALVGVGVLVTSAAVGLSPTCTSLARVTEVYPTADVLPENLLRFYIYFSEPMLREDALSSIHLVDDHGDRVNGAFLDNKFGLWSPNGRRLTLLFDPGRVKTGLVAHNTLGRALRPHQAYELIIDSTLRDLSRCPLAASHRKTFRVSMADDQAPDIQQWHLQPPRSHTRDSLAVALNGVHDHLSLAYRIRVKTVDDRVVPGRIDLANAEQQWQFVPDQPWQSQPYLLAIDPTLEDIAGNRMTGLFERPLEPGGQPIQVNWLTIPFQPSDPTQSVNP